MNLYLKDDDGKKYDIKLVNLKKTNTIKLIQVPVGEMKNSQIMQLLYQVEKTFLDRGIDNIIVVPIFGNNRFWKVSDLAVTPRGENNE